MTEALIVVPFDPPAACSSNPHAGRREIAAARKMLRMAAGLATLPLAEAEIPWLHDRRPVVVDAVIGWSTGRKLQDQSNLPYLLKAIIDGISDVLWKSQDRHVRIGEVTQCHDPDGRGYVEVRVRQEEG